jgi:hypothetical protein
MRRLTSILIITGAVLAVAQAAVAQLTVVPIAVTSQTLRVDAFNSSTGDVVGGGSVGTSWNFGNEHGSTVGSITSELINGELVITVVGALSKGATAGSANVGFEITPISFALIAPEFIAPIFIQLTRVSSEFVGPVEFAFAESHINFPGYLSDVLGGLATMGYMLPGEMDSTMNSVASSLPILIAGDTVELKWGFEHSLQVPIDNSTGTFSETFTIRAVTPTPVPEPTSSLTIPSGAAMLIALAKLRGVSLIH